MKYHHLNASKIHLNKTTIANGKKNKQITIAHIITTKANGMYKITLYMKEMAKQIAYTIYDAHQAKKSRIFLIFILCFIWKEYEKPQEYRS